MLESNIVNLNKILREGGAHLIRVVHYINQFYAGIGGEEKADIKPEVREGFVGPGMGLNGLFKAKGAEIVATVICGDSYFNENMTEAKAEITEMVKKYNPDIFIAGPAFNAGRYGVACGAIAAEVQEKLNIPVLSAMYEENPGADMYKKHIYIVSTKNSAVGMRDALPKIAGLAIKLANKEELQSPEAEGYFERGIRKNYFAAERGSKRAVDMLVKKLKGEAFTTEFKMPTFDRVEPAAPVADITKAKIAIVTSGGTVPKGNPDHIESSSASKFGKYDIEGVMDLTSETYETAHGGYDPTYANTDNDRVIPVDVLRELEKEGKIGSLHKYFYSTVGNGTAVASSKKYGQQIAKELIADGVTAVILTST
jgi:glycine reductase complex component B subunit gamma